ncbi:MAG: hypothetical protein ACKVE4_03735 [Dissulfuribacterales bacterium]
MDETLENIKEAVELYLEDIGDRERKEITGKSIIIAPIEFDEAYA